MPFPRFGRLTPIWLGVAVRTFGTAHDLGLTVARNVRKRGRFVVGYVQHIVACPVAFFALRILVPRRFLARKTENENIRPAITVEVVGEGKKIVRVGVLLSERAFEARNLDFAPVIFLELKLFCCGVVLVTFPEVRPFPPVWTRDNIHFAIVIEIAKVRAFRPKLVSELNLLEGVKFVIFGRNKQRARKQNTRKKGKFHNALVCQYWRARSSPLKAACP